MEETLGIAFDRSAVAEITESEADVARGECTSRDETGRLVAERRRRETGAP